MTDSVARLQHGDRPLEPSGEDKLGFRLLARELAISLVEYSANSGFVVGIEGAWGTGKSSLVNLTLDEIEAFGDRAICVRFAPWLVGSRDTLLEALFSELELAIAKIKDREASEVVASAAAKALDQLRVYARKAGSLSGIADIAALLGVPAAGTIGEVLRKIGDVASVETSEKSLLEIKAELEKSLLLLPKKIILVIDDLDRLEPSEALEVLRLIRAVADFPSIVYLVCFDKVVLGNAIAQELGIDDGQEYLKKIVHSHSRCRAQRASTCDTGFWRNWRTSRRCLNRPRKTPQSGSLPWWIWRAGVI